ncbi:Pleckstrin y domain-containing G member 1 [Apophysomyces sp. BC1015]|nr:Pleckstrin y domain-containing G member 1 [Apophysomyces sp. BC1015]
MGLALWKQTLAGWQSDPSKYPNKTQFKRSVQQSKYVMMELLATEQTYLHHLTTVKSMLMDPLMNAVRCNLIHRREIQPIFGYIPQLILLSTALVRQFDDANKPSAIGQVFCNFEDAFSVYIAYAANYARSLKCAAKANRHLVYRQAVKTAVDQTNRMTLADYLIAPIQRITRYCLLLKELEKYSAPSDSLDTALRCLSALALAMNDIQ